MTTTITAADYIIHDIHAIAIFGFGATQAEAWGMVVDYVGSFHDANGDDIPADEAFATQFVAREASAGLIALVRSNGGGVAWGFVDGIATTIMEVENA